MKAPGESDALVELHRCDDVRVRLVCFPFAGGGANVFRGWGGRLPPGVQLLGVRYPGRESRWRQPPLTSIAALAEALLPALEPALERPCAFFGHSMGALVAFELILRLARRGVAPAILFVSACRAPHLPRVDFLHRLPDQEFVAEIVRLGGMSADVLGDGELMSLLVPLLRADLEACDAYVPSVPVQAVVTCPLVGLGAVDDPWVSQSDLVAWRAWARGPEAVHWFHGGHFFIQSDSDAVLASLSSHLMLRSDTAPG